MADKAADIDHVWKLIEDIPIAMVVTHEGQGQNMRGSANGCTSCSR